MSNTLFQGGESFSREEKVFLGGGFAPLVTGLVGHSCFIAW